MQIKIYRANYLKKLVLQISVDGKPKTIEFGGASHYLKKNAVFSTSDSVIQKALEKHSGFGSLFSLESSQVIAQDSAKADPAQADGVNKPFEFANFNELRDFLVKEKGLAPITVSTMDRAEKAMNKLGLKFIIQ